MSRRGLIVPALAVVVGALGGGVPARAADTAPHYDVRATWADTNLPPGGEGQFQLQVRDVGGEPAEQPLTIEDRLPEGVTATGVHWDSEGLGGSSKDLSSDCSIVGGGATVKCVLPGSEVPSRTFAPSAIISYAGIIYIEVAIAPEPPSNPGVNVASVTGGGASLPDGSPCAQSPAEVGPLPACATDTDRVPFSATPAPFEVVPGNFEAGFFSEAYPFGELVRQAGAHPFEQRIDFELSQSSLMGTEPSARYENSKGLLKTVEVTLPPGMLGNPEAVPKCDPLDFAGGPSTYSERECPSDTQVGYLNVALSTHKGRGGSANPNGSIGFLVPIYNLVPPKGTPVDLAFNVSGVAIGHIYANLDPAQDYAIKAVVPNITETGGIVVRASETVLWGVPADPAHNRLRYYPKPFEGKETGASWGSAAIRPFFTSPMDCEARLGVETFGMRIRVASYEDPELSPAVEASPVPVEGCDDSRFRFQPDIALEPSDHHAGAPTGLEVRLKVPQRNDQVENAQELYTQNGFVKGIATPPIKKTVVTLPQGMTLNPSAGQGLTGCSLSQLGMSAAGVPNGEPVKCPPEAQIGKLILHSPDLPVTEPLEGRVYIARQSENPFGSLFALYLVMENSERGLLVKLAGEIKLDESTGQITTTFDNLPQFPVSDLSLQFKSGARAALVEPSTCGLATITATYYSWQDPNTPHTTTNSYPITQKPDGSPCVNSLAELPFGPALQAETLNPVAGAYAPLFLRVSRGDGDQALSRLRFDLPPGLVGKIAGVPQCPEAGIAQAKSREGVPGDGALELADPSCPAVSQVGSVQVGTGTGSSLAWVSGKAYFAGPYKGAPFSVVVITPAVVGPYDLGDVVVRNALYIDPLTAQVHVVSDPLPQIFDGILVRIRDVRVSIDRSQFMFNPTNCQETRIDAQMTGSVAQAPGAPVASRLASARAWRSNRSSPRRRRAKPHARTARASTSSSPIPRRRGARRRTSPRSRSTCQSSFPRG